MQEKWEKCEFRVLLPGKSYVGKQPFAMHDDNTFTINL